MTSKEDTVVAPLQNDIVNDAVLPQVGVFVTADVRVVQYRSSDSLGHCDDTKCTIVTSLSAVINEPINQSVKSQPCSKSKECIADTAKTPVLLREACDHPNVHRSKKNTQLNRINISEFTGKRAQIDRTVILPYLGCTRRFEPFRSEHIHVHAKSSKSWETLGKSNKIMNVKPFRSQTFNTGASINNTSSKVNVLEYQTKERLLYSFGEYELSNTGVNTSKEAVRSFYLIQTPPSGPKFFSNRKNTVKKDNNLDRQNYNLEFPALSYRNKNELYKNITGVNRNIHMSPAKLNFKTTRNVSTQHRPKTRDKSTSTTFLDGDNIGKELDKSIKGLLTPYIASGRDFPSEITLKLVPKAEALKNLSNESSDQANRSKDSSEVDLLAPTLNDNNKHRKKSSKGLWNCFSKKKNTSDYSSEKEVYFPSIVEVQKKKKKSVDQSNSDLVL